MISTIIACVLPLVTSLDADVSATAQIAPGITIGLHTDSYYDQREQDRSRQLAQLQSERDADRQRQESLDHEKSRGRGSLFFWRDTKDQHERKRQDLSTSRNRNEQARTDRERTLHDEENRDLNERQHR